jgi:hypothetical protein
MPVKHIICILSFAWFCSSISAQQDQYLIDELLAQDYLNGEEVFLVDQDHFATSIYHMKTDQHKWARYSKRRRYFADEELTEHARKLISLLLEHQQIDSLIYLDMYQRTQESGGKDHPEPIVDALSVWQYLSEKELWEASFQPDSIRNYLGQLREIGLIGKQEVNVETIRTKKEVIAHLDRYVILEDLDRFQDLSSFNAALNRPDQLEQLQLAKYYEPEIASALRFGDYYNKKLSQDQSPYRLIMVTRTFEDNYVAIVSVTEEQYNWINSRSTHYEYPFFNPHWMKIGTFAENPFVNDND